MKLVAGEEDSCLESVLQVKYKCRSETPLRKTTDNLALLSGVLGPKKPSTCTHSS